MSGNENTSKSLQMYQALEANSAPKIKPSTITRIKGKDTASYEGMLDYAHQHGITKLGVELIQSPSKENDQTAICRAILETTDGRIFADIGDASPSNTPRGCSDHFIRLASTRAKTRVLCDAFNIKSKINSAHENDHQTIDVDNQVNKQTIVHSPAAITLWKPISDKQKYTIKSLASKSNISDIDLDALSREKFKKDINSLSTNEAHFLIQHIRS